MSTLIRPLTRLATLAVTLSVLTGCASGWWKKDPETRPCPTVAVLADAATITVYRDGPGRDLTDVLYEGRFTGFNGACVYDTDSDTGAGRVEVEVEVNMTAIRGPADTKRTAPLRYFVSITDPARTVLSREEFDVTAEFPGNTTQVTIDKQPIYMTLPLAPGQTGKDYAVFIGFQLTREQLDDNRRIRTR